MEFYYVNSKNERINFYEYPYVLQETDVLDYTYSYTKNNFGGIKNFRKETIEKKIVIAIVPNKSLVYEQRKEEFKKHLDRLQEIVDYDTANGIFGRLYTDTGFYLSCNIIANKKNTWASAGIYMSAELTVLTPNATWIKEEFLAFGGITNPIISIDGFDYTYDYTYDYSNTLVNQKVVVEGSVPSHFAMTIYGACENPAVSIGTRTYKVNTTLLTGEYLTIDTLKKKLIKTTNSGTQVSVFDARDRSYPEFYEKIPAGTSAVAWSGGFGFDLTLYMERSEPAWT